MLRQRILAQYPAALIDEFQDTSPQQFRLFDALYRVQDNDPAQVLLLIGDPKQSIYGFRGADIHSYLQARLATEGRHHKLATNHRSSQALVQAVNLLFQQAEDRPGRAPSASGRTARTPCPSCRWTPKDGANAGAGARPRHPAALPLPAITLHVDAPLRKAAATQRQLAAAAAETLVNWLNDPDTGFLHDDGRWQRLQPSDVAVLVRSGHEARSVRQALARRGLPSVYLSDRDPVTRSPEAQDLWLWLQAVAEPQRAERARRPGPAGHGPVAARAACPGRRRRGLDERCQWLRELQLVWRQQGVLAMIRQTLQRLDLPARWLGQLDGERRLTNVLHLAELLQQESLRQDGEQALIRWLHQQIHEPDTQAEEQVMRLESDAELVQVVTVHKSKGGLSTLWCSCLSSTAPCRCGPRAWPQPAGPARMASWPGNGNPARTRWNGWSVPASRKTCGCSTSPSPVPVTPCGSGPARAAARSNTKMRKAASAWGALLGVNDDLDDPLAWHAAHQMIGQRASSGRGAAGRRVAAQPGRARRTGVRTGR